jgi:ribonucleoside-diphosphate reductase alpha chain
MLKLQTISKPELVCPKDKNGKYLLNEYVFGVDVARSNSQSNNKSCVVILKIIRNPKVFKIYLAIMGIDEMKEGSFTLKPSSSAKDIAKNLSISK